MSHPGVFAWLVAVVWLLSYEWFALATGRESLSRAVVFLSKWGPFEAVLGIVVGGLIAHFYWRWDPDRTNKGA